MRVHGPFAGGFRPKRQQPSIAKMSGSEGPIVGLWGGRRTDPIGGHEGGSKGDYLNKLTAVVHRFEQGPRSIYQCHGGIYP